MSHGHKSLLQRLEAGSRSGHSFSHLDVLNSQQSVHYSRYLNEMQRAGLVVEIDKMWHLTQGGREALHNSTEKVKAPSWVGVGVYQGEELKSRVARAGAYDFLKYPSRMGDKRIFLQSL